jgi:hypothetical protein
MPLTYLLFRARRRAWRSLSVVGLLVMAWGSYSYLWTEGLASDEQGRLTIVNESPRAIYLITDYDGLPPKALEVGGALRHSGVAPPRRQVFLRLDGYWFEGDSQCLRSRTLIVESLSNEGEYGVSGRLPDGSFGPLPSVPADLRAVGEVPALCLTEDKSSMAWTGTALEQRKIPWKFPSWVGWAIVWLSPVVAALLGIRSRARRKLPTNEALHGETLR